MLARKPTRVDNRRGGMLLLDVNAPTDTNTVGKSAKRCETAQKLSEALKT